MNDQLVIEFDDFPIESTRTLEYFNRLKQEYPGIKLTMFAIPSLMTEELWGMVDPNWMQIGIHGYTHQKGEMRKRQIPESEHYDKLAAIIQDTRWTHIFKPPHYGYSASVLRAASRLGLSPAIRVRGDIYTHFASPEDVPSIQCYIKYDRPEHARFFSHPVEVPQLFSPRIQSQFPARYAACQGRCSFVSECLEPAMRKIYLGSGEHILPGFDHYDLHQYNPIIKPWCWSTPIPLPANSCSIVLIQQSLMYCAKDKYGSTLDECRRVLAPGGCILIKEDNNKVRIWNHGRVRGGGMVLSNTNREEMAQSLETSGYKVDQRSSIDIYNAYPGYFNRWRKVRRDQCFIVRAVAPKEEVVYEY